MTQFGIELFLVPEGHLLPFVGDNKTAIMDFLDHPENMTLEEAVTGFSGNSVIRFADPEVNVIRKRLADLGFREMEPEDYIDMDIRKDDIIAVFMN